MIKAGFITISCYKYYLILLFFSYFVNTFSYAISPADQELIQQQQRTWLEESLKQRESLKNNLSIDENSDFIPSEEDEFCFEIKNIQFVQSFDLSKKEQKSLIKKDVNHCLSIAKIEQLIRRITNYYIGKGYVTTFASLEEQDISGGTLIITINTTKIESILLDDKKSKMVKGVFPAIVGKAVNLRDIEQGLEQLSRLSSKQVTIDILPGKKSGYSIIALKSIANTSTSPVSLTMSVDNSGQKKTGTHQLATSLTFDNLFQLADQIQFSLSRNSDFDKPYRSNSLSAGISIPYGYWLINYFYSRNEFYHQIQLYYNQFPYQGSSQSHQLSATRLFYRDGKSKFSGKLSLNRRENENRFAGQILELSSPSLSSISAGLNYSTALWGGYFTFNTTYQRGLSILGATKEDNESPLAPQSGYNKLSINSSYSHSLGLANAYYLSSFYAQTTDSHLYDADRISIGGEYSVRGYKNQSLSGNKGFYWRNEIAQQIELPFSWALQLGLSFDMGWIQSQNEMVDGGLITGTSVKATLSHAYMNHSLSFGIPLHYPVSLSPDKWALYYQLSFLFQ